MYSSLVPTRHLTAVIQLFQQLVGLFAHAAYQQIATLESVVNEVIHQTEIFNLSGVVYMHPGTGTGLNGIAYADMVFVYIGNRQVLCNDLLAGKYRAKPWRTSS